MIADNLAWINARIQEAAERSGRDPREITLIAVTKKASVETLLPLLEARLIHEIGESRVQDASLKRNAVGNLGSRVRWRMIGRLQTNKIAKAVSIFDSIDSLDDFRTADALESKLGENGKKLPVLIQVKFGDDPQRSGIGLSAVERFLKGLGARQRLDCRGLMAIMPHSQDRDLIRSCCRKLRTVFQDLFSGRKDAELSMGMSGDFELAIEEGATHVRIGSALFGSAPAAR